MPNLHVRRRISARDHEPPGFTGSEPGSDCTGVADGDNARHGVVRGNGTLRAGLQGSDEARAGGRGCSAGAGGRQPATPGLQNIRFTLREQKRGISWIRSKISGGMWRMSASETF